MEGGMVVTDNNEICHLLRSLRAHGWTRDLPKETEIFKTRTDDFFEAYRFILPGYNVRPLEISGAIGIEQLKKLPAMTIARRKNLAFFQKLFENDERFIIQKENGKSSSFSFPIIINPEKKLKREKIFAALQEAEIGYRIITGGYILRHDVAKFFKYDTAGQLKNAEIAHDYGFFVGNHPFDLENELTYLAETLKNIS